jgi:hypothetical protein
LLNEVLAPAFLGIEIESDGPRYEPAKSSVPWSEFLKSSSRNTQEQSASQSQHAQQQSSYSHDDPTDATLETVPTLACTPRLYERDRQDSSGRLIESPLHTDRLQKDLDFRDATGSLAVAVPGMRKDVNQLGRHTPLRTDGEIENNPVAIDELQILVDRNRLEQEEGIETTLSHQSQGNTEEAIVVSPSTKANHKFGLVPKSDDDLMTLGLPAEQYRPRPSRSRSLKVTRETSIDYSVRPEKAARKPRRSRTSGVGENASSVSTPEKVQQICDMGFTPVATQKALKQNNGDITSTVDWLVANDVTQDELAPVRLSKVKTQRKERYKQDVSLDATDTLPHSASLSNIQRQDNSSSKSTEGDVIPVISTNRLHTEFQEHKPVSVPSKSPRVKVLIPRSEGQFPTSDVESALEAATASNKHPLPEVINKKPKRRKTSLDQPETSPEEIATIAIETPKDKKRGRGRPRKELKPTLTVLEGQDKDQQVDITPGTDTVIQVQHAPAVHNTSNTGEEEISRETTPALLHSALSSPRKTTQVVASETPPQTPKKVMTAAASTNSPVNKGKVLYRVGLSKRARIAPLLRSVKK